MTGAGNGSTSKTALHRVRRISDRPSGLITFYLSQCVKLHGLLSGFGIMIQVRHDLQGRPSFIPRANPAGLTQALGTNSGAPCNPCRPRQDRQLGESTELYCKCYFANC